MHAVLCSWKVGEKALNQSCQGIAMGTYDCLGMMYSIRILVNGISGQVDHYNRTAICIFTFSRLFCYSFTLYNRVS